MLFYFICFFIRCIRIYPEISIAMDIDVCGYVELLEYGADCFGLGLAEWGWAVVLLAAGLSGGLDCVEIVVEITVNIYSQYPVFAFLW